MAAMEPWEELVSPHDRADMPLLVPQCHCLA